MSRGDDNDLVLGGKCSMVDDFTFVFLKVLRLFKYRINNEPGVVEYIIMWLNFTRESTKILTNFLAYEVLCSNPPLPPDNNQSTFRH